MEMTVRDRKFQLVSGLFDDSAEYIMIHTEYRLKVFDDTYRIGSVKLCRALVCIVCR